MNSADQPVQEAKLIQIPNVIRVGDFANQLDISVSRVIAELMKNGVFATINEQIDFDTASIIGSDLGFDIQPEAATQLTTKVSKTIKLVARPPVVAIMGHVDHGKTSLLDTIRNTNVVAGESGGITQHIGAYQIKYKDRLITFLDTPGHEAFSALRAHGAKITDVAIIVVAADDGVKPQTVEAINHAKEAGIQIIIAINKIDKEGADPNKVRQQLSELELVPEEWGGKTVMINVSAKTGENIDQLLDLVLLVVDIEEIKARPTGLAEGVVIESHLATGRGVVATVLIQNGILKPSDVIVVGSTYGKIKNLEDFKGKKIKQAVPGMPAIITGIKEIPSFGEFFEVVADEKEARNRIVEANRNSVIKSLVRPKKINAQDITNAITAGKIKELNVVLKADVQGSLKSVASNLGEIKNDEVAVKIISSGVGDISESDVTLAKTAGAIILGFNTGISPTVRQLALREQVQIRLYKVIYELLDDIKQVLSEMLEPEIIEIAVGKLDVLGIFKITKTHVVCGGKLTSGKIQRDLQLKIEHQNQITGSGKLISLQKEKQEVKEAKEGDLCGLDIATSDKIEINDKIEFYNIETRARQL